MAQAVRRADGEPGHGAAAAAARERPAEEGGRPADAGRGHPQGGQRKKMVSAPARREQVDYVVARGRSVRRACALMDVSRSALRYVSTMPARDSELAGELTQISAKRAAYGYRFAWALLGRRGW